MIESFLKGLAKQTIQTLNKTGNYSSREKIRGFNRENKKKLAQHLLEFLPKDNPVVGIDVGAGDGEFANVMKEVNPDIHYISADPFIQRDEKNDVPFIQAEAEKLPFADESLDFVTAHFAFHHFNDKFAAFKEALRTLKPGGILLIKEEFIRYPGQEWIVKINDEVSNEKISGVEYAAAFVENVSYFSRDEIQEIITAAQLHVLENSSNKPIRWFEWFYKTQKRLFVLQKPRTIS